jgi:hypothetical protein
MGVFLLFLRCSGYTSYATHLKNNKNIIPACTGGKEILLPPLEKGGKHRRSLMLFPFFKGGQEDLFAPGLF